jgi:flagellar basal body-associated protein FliL
MKSGARMLGMAILGLVVLTAVSVAGLSAWVYSGPEREKQASAIARELFHLPVFARC